MRKFKWRTNTIVFLALLSVALTTLYPLIYVAITSARTLEDYVKNAYGLPKFFTLDSYRILIDNYSLGTAARNTVIVVGVSLATALVFSSLAGFALAKYDFPGSKVMNWSFIAVMLLPSQILIIPIYLLLSKFSLVGHLHGLMFVYIGTNIPFGVFFLKSTFSAVPDTILDAARIDGAGFFTSFFRIAIPNAAAGITTLAVLQFLGMWNELLYAYLILPDQGMRLLTPALASIGGRYTTNQPLVAAAAMYHRYADVDPFGDEFEVLSPRSLNWNWVVMISSKSYTINFDDLSLARIHYWSSDWGTEWTPHQLNAQLPLDIAVTAGRSSKGHHPFIIIEDGNTAHFLAVAWSGNWQIACSPSLNNINIVVATDAEETHIVTKTVSSGGIDAAMREFISDFRSMDTHTVPKLLTEWNSWWPYEDVDINEAMLLANASCAKKAGIEVAVLDAGWFGPAAKDSHWHNLRGDWDQRNMERFPSGLKAIGNEVRKLGIDFGVWLEIEALGDKAELATTHPEFIAEHNGESLQYVCLGNPDAFTWALKVSKSLIQECGASWIKIDFNVDPGLGCNRTDHGHGSELGLNDHLNNLYSLMDTLKTDYPDLTIENCSSGGLRWDLAMASHVDMGFASDPDWPEHSLACFWASSLFFPAEKLLGWCDSQWRGNHPQQDFRAIESSDVDLEFALAITLLGGFGISAKLPEFSESKMQMLTDFVSIYKEYFRPRFQDAAFIKHLTPQPERDQKGARTVAFAIESASYPPLLTIYQLDGSLSRPTINYLPPKSEAIYQVKNLVSGEILFPRHQGTLTLENNLKDNAAMILSFIEISG